MSKIINLIDSTMIITMKGSIDLEHYCEKCESNEFHSCLGVSCALCGHEVKEFKSTAFDCTPEEKEYLLAKAKYVNDNVVRVGFSAFNYEQQMELNNKFDEMRKG